MGFVGSWADHLLATGDDVWIESPAGIRCRLGPENEIQRGLIGRSSWSYYKWQLVTEGTVGSICSSLLADIAQYHPCFQTIRHVHHFSRTTRWHHVLRVIRSDHKREGERTFWENLTQPFLAINTCFSSDNNDMHVYFKKKKVFEGGYKRKWWWNSPRTQRISEV